MIWNYNWYVLSYSFKCYIAVIHVCSIQSPSNDVYVLIRWVNIESTQWYSYIFLLYSIRGISEWLWYHLYLLLSIVGLPILFIYEECLGFTDAGEGNIKDDLVFVLIGAQPIETNRGALEEGGSRSRHGHINYENNLISALNWLPEACLMPEQPCKMIRAYYIRIISITNPVAISLQTALIHLECFGILAVLSFRGCETFIAR